MAATQAGSTSYAIEEVTHEIEAGDVVFDSLVLLPGGYWGRSLRTYCFDPGTGVPLQTSWIPVHKAITVFLILSLILAWENAELDDCC